MANYFVNAETKFVDIGEAEISAIVGVVQDLLGDFMPLLTLIFGVMIAIFLIGVLLRLIGGNTNN